MNQFPKPQTHQSVCRNKTASLEANPMTPSSLSSFFKTKGRVYSKQTFSSFLKFLIVPLLCLVPGLTKANYIVTSGTTVTISTSPWHPSGDVIVETGGRLDITSGVTVQMDGDARITVEYDGRLRADGVTFTAYGNDHWIGIEILSTDQYYYDQPTASEIMNLQLTAGTGHKGGAYLVDCIVEKCKYGTVVGDIQDGGYNGIATNIGSSKGGGVLVADNVTYRYIDYIGICFTPYQRRQTLLIRIEDNNSIIENCTIYDDYNNRWFIGAALFNVSLGEGSFYNNTVENRLLTGGALATASLGTFGFYALESRFWIENCNFTGFYRAIEAVDIWFAMTRVIASSTFTDNWWDVFGNTALNLYIVDNTSDKDYSGGGSGNLAFTMIFGDFYYIGCNDISADNSTFGAPMDRGIFLRENSTPQGKLTFKNTTNDVANAVRAQGNNYGMIFDCNIFNDTRTQVVEVTSGGVSPVQAQGKYADKGVYNEFNSTCNSVLLHWHQNPGVSAVDYMYDNYYTINEKGKPICFSNSVHVAGWSTDWENLCSGDCIHAIPDGDFFWIIEDELEELTNVLADLPQSVSEMDNEELTTYYAARNLRDIRLSQLTSSYVNQGKFDSAFWLLDQYPCQRANLDKINLLITLDSNYSGYSTLIDAIADNYADCDTGYCNDTLSYHASVYYPILLDLVEHDFSDSVLDARHSALIGLAVGDSTYYSSIAQTILQVHYDSLFRVYRPRDETFQDSVLYPLEVEDIIYEAPTSPAGLTPADSVEKMVVYPNPTEKTLTVTYPGKALKNMDKFNFRIVTMEGKVLVQDNLSLKNNQANINVGSLPPGAYILELSSNGQMRQRINFIRK